MLYSVSHGACERAYRYLLLIMSSSSSSLFPLRYIGKSDSITISVWNHKKIHKKQGAGFLGCVRLLSNAINRLKDTGCKCQCHSNAATCQWQFLIIF